VHKYFFSPREATVDTSGWIQYCRCCDLRMKPPGPCLRQIGTWLAVYRVLYFYLKQHVPYSSQKLHQLVIILTDLLCIACKWLCYWWLLLKMLVCTLCMIPHWCCCCYYYYYYYYYHHHHPVLVL